MSKNVRDLQVFMRVLVEDEQEEAIQDLEPGAKRYKSLVEKRKIGAKHGNEQAKQK